MPQHWNSHGSIHTIATKSGYALSRRQAVFAEPRTHLTGMTITHFSWTDDMPLVRIAIAADGTLEVWAFGVTRFVPANLLHVDRMGLLLDFLFNDMGGPYTVEVIEADGTRRAGTINLNGVTGSDASRDAKTTPPPCVETSPVDPNWGPPDEGDRWMPDQLPTPPARRALPANGDDRFEADPDATAPTADSVSIAPPFEEEMVTVSATGLWPAERVCLAPVVVDGRADQEGRVSFLVPRRVIASLPMGEVMVYGQASHVATLNLPLLDR